MQIHAPLAVLAATAATACADVYPLSVFENAGNTSIAGLNLILEINPAPGGADLTFRNDSTIGSVITAIYLEGTTASQHLLLNPTILPQMPGVSFGPGASPPNPPGSIAGFGGPWQGNAFTLQANDPAPHKGLNPGDWLTLRFDGSASSIQHALEQGQFRIAQHVQGLGSGGEDSVWATTTAIPAPSSAALLILAGSVALRRRRK